MARAVDAAEINSTFGLVALTGTKVFSTTASAPLRLVDSPRYSGERVVAHILTTMLWRRTTRESMDSGATR